MADVIPFIRSPFKTKVEWEAYATLSPAGRITHAAILSEMMGVEVTSASLRDQSKMGGMSGDIKFLDVLLATGESLALVLKTAKGSPMRVAMGVAREAFFYNTFSSSLKVANVPRCFYARGDMATGEVTMLMQLLENAVPSGTFFGSAQPNNWGVKDKLEAMCAGNPTPDEITADAFTLYARMHATYWQDGKLLSKPWLRASGWYAGNGEATWKGAQAQAQGAWAKLRAAITVGESPIRWDDHLVACLDASFAKVDWAAYQAELNTRPFTLVHGDAHAHNFMWVEQRTPAARQCLIDFEMVGVGSGAQELGQYMISHTPPELRRAKAAEWVRGYHTELVAVLRGRGLQNEADAYTFDACFAEHVAGGVGRWVWFVPVLQAMGLPPPMNQFFHDQLAAFLHDHITDPSASPMPRV